MAVIRHSIVWASNTESLRAELSRGLDTIVAVKAGAEKMVQSLGGDRLIAAAHRMAAAVQEIGGVAKLTGAEQQRVNAIVEKAVEKYQVLGRTAPTALKQLAEATKGASKESLALAQLTERLGGGETIASAKRYAAAIQQIGGVSKLTRQEQEQINNVVTEAMAKYHALGQAAPVALQRLAAATKQTGTETNTVQSYVSTLVTSVGSMAAGFVSAQAVLGAVTTAYRTFVGFLRDSARAYIDAEASQNKLVAALRSQSMATSAVIKQYNDLATSFQRTTAFSDDLINDMQGLLVQVGGIMPSKMKDALKASTDLAAGLSIDLQQATMLVAKAAAGHTETLGRYGITVSEAALKTQGFDAVLEAVNRQFGGQAQAQLETYAGKLAQAASLEQPAGSRRQIPDRQSARRASPAIHDGCVDARGRGGWRRLALLYCGTREADPRPRSGHEGDSERVGVAQSARRLDGCGRRYDSDHR
jgi:hypothetical protein